MACICVPELSITSTMPKVLRVMILCAYGVLFLQYLRVKVGRSKDEIELEYVIRPLGVLKKLRRDLKQHSRYMKKPNFTYEKPGRLPTDLKYILKWQNGITASNTSILKNGQHVFIENNCTQFNCFITSGKCWLVKPSYFDAIIFDVTNIWDPLPILRAAHQRYIFMASESTSKNSYCLPLYDTYFNLTWTYKFDSDIRWSYITIEDKKGNFVGPKDDIKWIDPMHPTSQDVISRLINKQLAAAWYISHCREESGGEIIAIELTEELAKYNLQVDRYGLCADIPCSTEHIDQCLDQDQDYYFYFMFEDDLCEDHASEMLLYPLLHMIVPVVFGGANYSRYSLVNK